MLTVRRARIAGALGVCRRQAMRIMRRLEELGAFDKIRQGGWRRGAAGKVIPQVCAWRLDRRRAAALLGDIQDDGEMSP